MLPGTLGHLPGAFPEIFYRLEKATLGSSLALNASRRPWQIGNLPRAVPDICDWLQKGTLGSSLALNASRRPWPSAGRCP